MYLKNFIPLILILQISSLRNLKKKSVFDETRIKNLKLKNRIFRGSVIDCSFKNGKITEEGYKLYETLAKNEVGTIFTGTAVVSDYNAFDDNPEFRIDKDEYIEEYKKLTDLVHKNNANIFIQIIHNGLNTQSTNEKIYAPSAVQIMGQNRLATEMTKEDILRIEDDFVKAAIRAKKAGFDGIEIHSAHLYLLSEFLSPNMNKRTDEYGGNDENRARMLIEIIEKIRKAIGNDIILSLKIDREKAGNEGISEQGFLTACKLAEKAGIDIIQVSGFKWVKEKPKNGPYYFDAAKKLAEIVNIPVLLVGGIRTLDQIDFILNNSKIQYVVLSRPLICEPDIVKKWKNGDNKKSKCVSCNNCLKDFNDVDCVFNKKKRKKI